MLLEITSPGGIAPRHRPTGGGVVAHCRSLLAMTLYASSSLPKFFCQSAFCSAVFLAASPIFLNDLRFLMAFKIFTVRSFTSPSRNNQPLTPSSIHSLFPAISETRQGSPLASASINVTDEPSTCEGEI